ncbi:tyrosine-type recombinase/integrase [Methylomagnum sp.]
MSDRFTFTKKELEALPLPDKGRAYVHDGKVNGLVLQITPTGTKSFQAYRKVGGKPVRVTLGRYPDMTIEQARKAALAALSKLAGGVNPNTEKKRAKLESKTLAEAFADYQEARKDLKPSTVADMGKAFRQVCPDWLDKPLSRLTPAMIEARHQQYGEERSEAGANKAMRYLRAVFNFAQAKYQDEAAKPLIEHNPVKKLSQTRGWYRVDRRQTVIKPHELAAWVNAVLALPGAEWRDYFMAVLLTGMRREEALSLQWSEVDFTGRTLTVLDPKNHQDHTLPLSDYLLDLLTRRKAVSVSDYVFADSAGRRISNFRYAQASVEKASGVSFCIHDLRRTFATIAESLDIPAYALKRLLNHANGADVTAGYIVASTERLREPMQKITDFVLKAAGLKATAEVIQLKRETA